MLMRHGRIRKRKSPDKILEEVCHSIQRIQNEAVSIQILVRNAIQVIGISYNKLSNEAIRELERAYIDTIGEHLNIFGLVHNIERRRIEKLLPQIEVHQQLIKEEAAEVPQYMVEEVPQHLIQEEAAAFPIDIPQYMLEEALIGRASGRRTCSGSRTFTTNETQKENRSDQTNVARGREMDIRDITANKKTP
ncbi:hypothetical protein ABEB36_007132 [Hypothenemus hampei]